MHGNVSGFSAFASQARLALAVDAKDVALDGGVGAARQVFEAQAHALLFDAVGLLAGDLAAHHQCHLDWCGIGQFQSATGVALLQLERLLLGR